MPTYFRLVLYCTLATFSALHGQSFREVSAAAGIETTAVDPLLMAGGVAWLDYNNDRFPDLIFTNGLEATRLFRNNWDGTFTDVSTSSGLLNLAGTMGVVSGDFDSDGFVDLFFTTMAGTANRLLRNNGTGGFEDVSRYADITEASYSASATTSDYDGDGDLDVYVTNYLAGATPREGGLPNFLYRNDGEAGFTEVAVSLALDDAGCGLGAIFSDFNNDGRSDLYVTNDYGYAVEPNAYFRNGYPSFTNEAFDNGTAATVNAMGIAKGDYDNDDDQDIYVTNIRDNLLFTNSDAGDFFSFSSVFAGVALPELTGWGAAFTDFDLDGNLDLFVANGQVAGTINEAEPQTYFRNNGDGTFTDASESSGVGEVIKMARGLAVADYDLDGFPDVAINTVQPDFSGAEQMGLLHNEGGAGGKWLAIEVPVNALRVTLYSGGRQWLREVDGGSSYLSHSAGPIHFGVPDLGFTIDSLVVSFTNLPGATYTGLPWDRLVGIRPDGSWYEVAHERETQCGALLTDPVVESRWNTDAEGKEFLRLRRSQTIPYRKLAGQSVSLTAGEVFRGLARTQDAVLVDTVAGEGPCPDLQPIHLRVRAEVDRPLVYPNPISSGQLRVGLPGGDESVSLELYAVSGAKIWGHHQSVTTDQRTVSCSVSYLPNGIYLLRVTYAGKKTHHKLFHL